MTTLSKQHATIFFLGFIALVVAVTFGGLGGEILDPHPFLRSLRVASVSLMASGLALWVVLRRTEAGEPEINPLIGFLVVFALVATVLVVLFPQWNLNTVLGYASMGLGLTALLVATLAMIFWPAYPQPVVVKWDEDAPAKTDTHDSHETPAAADDLTKIEGIGPKLQEILNAAGIKSFAELASKSAGDITSLVEAGAFKAPFDATSWPEQASLAAQGDWEALEQLQNSLVGGRQG